MSVEILERILDHTHVSDQEKNNWDKLKANKTFIGELITGPKVLEHMHDNTPIIILLHQMPNSAGANWQKTFSLSGMQLYIAH